MSFSAYGLVGPDFGDHIIMYLYKNGLKIPESQWRFAESSGGALNNNVGVVSSLIVVSNNSDCFLNFGGFPECKISFSPDCPYGCRRHFGAENDRGRLYQFYHSQH